MVAQRRSCRGEGEMFEAEWQNMEKRRVGRTAAQVRAVATLVVAGMLKLRWFLRKRSAHIPSV